MKSGEIYEGEGAGLESLRAEIDECDKQIIAFLARRFELVRKIGMYKAIHNLPVVDEARETELLSDRVRRASGGGNYAVENIFKLIMGESRLIQKKVKEELGQDKLDD